MSERVSMNCELSIIVPAYNEGRLISHGLNSISKYLHPIAYEIIVVDNGSTDDTAIVAAAHSGVQVVSIPRSTISRARNTGARLAKGVLLAFLDADVMVTSRWAAALEKKLRAVSEGGDYYGGFPFDIPKGASLIERAWFPASYVGRLSYVGSANLIVSARLFQQISGFDETLRTAEDVDLGRRVTAVGKTIDFDPEFHAIHLGFPRTLRHFVKREMWHGQENFRSLSRFLNSKVTVAATLFAAMAISGVAAVISGHLRTGMTLLCLYTFMPALYVVYRLKLRNVRYLPMQYLLAHLYLSARAAAAIGAMWRKSFSGHRLT